MLVLASVPWVLLWVLPWVLPWVLLWVLLWVLPWATPWVLPWATPWVLLWATPWVLLWVALALALAWVLGTGSRTAGTHNCRCVHTALLQTNGCCWDHSWPAQR